MALPIRQMILANERHSPVSRPRQNLPPGTLIERDDNIPGFDVLLAERDRAQTLLNIGKKRPSEVTI